MNAPVTSQNHVNKCEEISENKANSTEKKKHTLGRANEGAIVKSWGQVAASACAKMTARGVKPSCGQ